MLSLHIFTESKVKECIRVIFASGLVVALLGIFQQVMGLHYNPKLMRLAGEFYPWGFQYFRFFHGHVHLDCGPLPYREIKNASSSSPDL